VVGCNIVSICRSKKWGLLIYTGRLCYRYYCGWPHVHIART